MEGTPWKRPPLGWDHRVGPTCVELLGRTRETSWMEYLEGT